MMESNEHNTREKEADQIIRNSVIFASGAGLIPIPIADFFAVTAVQLEMIRRLCRLYEVEFKETEGKAAVMALTSSGLARISGRILAKFIPVVGSIVGGLAVSILSGASTYAVGEIFKKHFKGGGTFLDFDWTSFKNYYNEKFEKGKAYTEKLKREQAMSSETSSPGVAKNKINDLQQLFDMKESGAISEEEYNALKAELLAGHEE